MIMMACHRINRSNHWSLLSVFPNLIWKHGGYSYNPYWIPAALADSERKRKAISNLPEQWSKSHSGLLGAMGLFGNKWLFHQGSKTSRTDLLYLPTHHTQHTPPLSSSSSFFSPSFLPAIFVKGGLEIKHVEVSSTYVRVENFHHLGISRSRLLS